jgi:hypothetical protein
MSLENQDRREHQRGSDILTQIEDVTYAILRDRSSNSAATNVESYFAGTASDQRI